MTPEETQELMRYRARNYLPGLLTKDEVARQRVLEAQVTAESHLPTRPLKRKYILVEGQGLVDERLVPQEKRGRSAWLDPLFRGRLYRNITSRPIWVDSRRQLKSLLKQYNRVECG